jgi:hypothetical protein
MIHCPCAPAATITSPGSGRAFIGSARLISHQKWPWPTGSGHPAGGELTIRRVLSRIHPDGMI